MIHFTADTHFGHKNILKHQPNRGKLFSNIEEHDQYLVDRWNEVVNPYDTVYHLGDFSMCSDYKSKQIFKSLNGNIHLILGNHDSFQTLKHPDYKFVSISNYKEIKVEGISIVLLHYAMRVWDKSHYGSYHLYGHNHGSLPDDPNSRSFDTGVDCHNLQPIPFSKVKELMDLKNFTPINRNNVTTD